MGEVEYKIGVSEVMEYWINGVFHAAIHYSINTRLQTLFDFKVFIQIEIEKLIAYSER